MNDKKFDHPVRAIQYLQSIAQPFAIGRDIHVGDTIIGIKGRVGFEAAAPLIIIKAHHLLEKHTLTKWQLYWKEQLSAWYGNWLHEGQMLDPTMRNIEKFLEDTQATVSGKVFVTLEPYRFTVTGIESPHDLMSSRFGSYGEMNSGWTGDDVKGFAKIFGNQTAIYHKINEGNQQETKVTNEKNQNWHKGGAGYTGGELIRILVNHPQAEMVFVQSKSNAGKAIAAVHQDLAGDTGLRFTDQLQPDIDVLYLCVGHGEARKFLSENAVDQKIRHHRFVAGFPPECQSSFSGKRISFCLWFTGIEPG